MEFRILGPLLVLGDNGEPVPVAQPRQRALLCTLLLHANEPLSADMLMDSLWGERPPQAARGSLRTYVWSLRRLLGSEPRLQTTLGGYLIEADADELDTGVFDRLVRESRQLVSSGQATLASDRLRRALGLWRNPPFADIVMTPAVAGKVELFRSRKYAAQELLIRLEMGLGGHLQLVPTLRELVAEDPSREFCWAQLMTALYRSGRRVEAIAAYSHAYAVLGEEFGIEPGPRLRRLHERVLAADPALERGPAFRTGSAILDGAVLDSEVLDIALPVAAGGAAPLPDQVPHVPIDFVGRDAELAELLKILNPLEAFAGVPVVVLTGLPGVGKTTMAAKVGHALRESFPDGLLYLELSGSADRPRPASEVLRDTLISLGIPASGVPESVPGRSAVFRSWLAGRRVLVVIDDAARPADVLPLLPGTAGSVVLVTSRAQLEDLPGAMTVGLEPLPEDDAENLLSCVVGAEWAKAEPEAARSLLTACGGLPRALRIAGVRLRSRENRALRVLPASPEAAEAVDWMLREEAAGRVTRGRLARLDLGE